MLPVPIPLLRGAGRLTGKVGLVERLVDTLQADSSKATRAPGWRPPVDVAHAFANIVKWFRGPGS